MPQLRKETTGVAQECMGDDTELMDKIPLGVVAMADQLGAKFVR